MNKVPGIWKWTVGILFVLNLALLATIWLKPAGEEHHMPPRHGEGGQPSALIQSKLHFTEEQNSIFETLRERHHDSIMMLQREGQGLRRQYFDNLKHPETADSNVIDSLGNAIGNNQKQIEFVTYRHFRQLRAICDDKQKAEFDEIIGEVLRIMVRQHGSKKELENNTGPENREHSPGPPRQ